MATSPSKLARAIVGLTVSKSYRQDALVAFDEGYQRVLTEEGKSEAQKWAFWQAYNSIPWGVFSRALQILYWITTIGTALIKIVS